MKVICSTGLKRLALARILCHRLMPVTWPDEVSYPLECNYDMCSDISLLGGKSFMSALYAEGPDAEIGPL